MMLYTMGQWSIYVTADGEHGSVDFRVGRPNRHAEFVAEGFVREGWFRHSIRSAWDKALKNVTKRHKKDLEAQAGMEMATNIAENWLFRTSD